VVASPLRRSWEGAALLAGGAPVRIEDGLREIDFGRWEGLSAPEIEHRDPVLYREWRARKPGFEYPGGELRAEFQGRVMRAFDRIEASGAESVLLVGHKGVIRTLAEKLTGAPLADGEPELARSVDLSRDPAGRGAPTPPRSRAGGRARCSHRAWWCRPRTRDRRRCRAAAGA